MSEHLISVAAGTSEIALDPAELTRYDKVTVASTAATLDVFLKFENVRPEKKIQLEFKLAPQTKTRVFYSIIGGAPGITSAFALDKQSHLDVFSSLKNTDATVAFDATIAKEAEAHFTGLTELKENEKSVVAVHVHHTEGQNLTHQKFYSYAADTSTIAFTGRITVSPGASGSVAHQLHRGVTLSEGARIDAQPFLNIMHDDVKCTHGSTVGFIDEDALHYLLARGIGGAEAEEMLILSSQKQFYDALPDARAAAFYEYKEVTL